MAMTFTLVSHLREQLSQLVRSKIEEHNQRESEKERLALEVRNILLYIVRGIFTNEKFCRRKKNELVAHP
jgi:hypothetical protein